MRRIEWIAAERRIDRLVNHVLGQSRRCGQQKGGRDSAAHQRSSSRKTIQARFTRKHLIPPFAAAVRPPLDFCLLYRLLIRVADSRIPNLGEEPSCFAPTNSFLFRNNKD